MTSKKTSSQQIILGGETTVFSCPKDLFAQRIRPAVELLDTLHVSLTGVSHLDKRPGEREATEAVNPPTVVSSGVDVATFLRRVYDLYLSDVADNPAKRFKIGEAGPVPMAKLPDILFALAGGLMMIRPAADPAIDRSILGEGQGEEPVHFGRQPSKNHVGVGAEGFTNALQGTKSYLCVVSVPRVAARLDRLRAVLSGSSFDGLYYRDRNGKPFLFADRLVMIFSVSSPLVTPKRLYEALIRSGAVNHEEIFNGFTMVDPFAARANADMACHIYVPGTTKGQWRLFGSTSERPLPRPIIEI